MEHLQAATPDGDAANAKGENFGVLKGEWCVAVRLYVLSSDDEDRM